MLFFETNKLKQLEIAVTLKNSMRCATSEQLVSGIVLDKMNQYYCSKCLQPLYQKSTADVIRSMMANVIC